MSAAPSATRQNLTAEPQLGAHRAGLAATKASVPGSRCERLTATVQAFGRWAGTGADRLLRGRRRHRRKVSRSAPRPTMPRQINPSAGAPTMPSSGVPSVTIAMLTVYSSRPATNSLVPSSGSTRKKLACRAAAPERHVPPTRRHARRSRARPSRMIGRRPGRPPSPASRRTCRRPSSRSGRRRVWRGRPGHECRQRFEQRCGGVTIDGGRNCLIHKRGSYSVHPFHPCRPRAGRPPGRGVSSQKPSRDLQTPPPGASRNTLHSRNNLCLALRLPLPLDALDLAALLCSRVCHDLISPVGAIVNGLEVLEDNPRRGDQDFALELIKKSAKTASARLQFCRLAFGAAGSAGAQIDLGDAQSMARGHIEDDKTKLTWNLPRVLLPKNRVKLLLNMLIVAQQTIPRGGTLTIEPIGEGETMGFRITPPGSMPACRRRSPRCWPASAEHADRRPCGPAVLYRPAGARLRDDGDARARRRNDGRRSASPLKAQPVATGNGRSWSTAWFTRAPRASRCVPYYRAVVDPVLVRLAMQPILNRLQHTGAASERRGDVACRCVRRPVSDGRSAPRIPDRDEREPRSVDVELVRFEQDPNNAKILDNIFRLVHTIKGTCGFLGLPRLEALAHAAETLMGKFRDGMPVTGEAVTLILSTIDRIKEILGGLEQTEPEPEGDRPRSDRRARAHGGAHQRRKPWRPPLQRPRRCEAPPVQPASGHAGRAVLERPLRPGEVSLDELERAFRETAIEAAPLAPAAAPAQSRARPTPARRSRRKPPRQAGRRGRRRQAGGRQGRQPVDPRQRRDARTPDDHGLRAGADPQPAARDRRAATRTPSSRCRCSGSPTSPPSCRKAS